ncbi:MAG: 50S ribosomal protein L27 [Candidatus Falkowbacteria bacterium]|nr:MAG: 50S ribosomal protein L27 [Candidatus Falkowbacteria bacterium]
MAHKKAAGSTSLGRESESKRLGVKLTDGEWAKTGSIIIRQRGTKYHPGVNVKKGNDDTLFAMQAGFVKFSTKKFKKFDGNLKTTKVVGVYPMTEAKRTELKKISEAAQDRKKKAAVKNAAKNRTVKKAAKKKIVKK